VTTIDAPISGGPQRARTGELAGKVSGDAAAIGRAQLVLDHLASNCFSFGATPGRAAAMKQLNDLLAGIPLAAAAEVIALGEQLGLDAKTMLNTSRSSGQSWIASDRLRRDIDGHTAPSAHLDILAKDSRLALELCEQHARACPQLGKH
jgi:L-threonate 2-dehydrogenase